MSVATKSGKKASKVPKGQAAAVGEANEEMISLNEIISNSPQTRAYGGVLDHLSELGYGLFEKSNPDKEIVWPMFFSSRPEERKEATRLIREFEPSMAIFAKKIRNTGQLQSIGVVRTKDGYTVIYGMRRAVAKAYNHAEHDDPATISARVYDGSKLTIAQLKLMALDENDDRDDESPMDKAMTYDWFVKEAKLSTDDIGKRTHQSAQNIRNYIKLLSPLLKDKRLLIHRRELSVDRALKLLQKRKAQGSEAEDTRKPASQKNRSRLPGVKGILKIYEAKYRLKTISEKEWELWQLPEVRKFFAYKLGLKYKPYAGSNEVEEAPAKTKKGKKQSTEPSTNGDGARVQLKVKRKRAQDLLISLGKTSARTWEDSKLKSSLENVVNLVEPNQKAETESLQKLLDRLITGYSEGLRVKIIED